VSAAFADAPGAVCASGRPSRGRAVARPAQ